MLKVEGPSTPCRGENWVRRSELQPTDWEDHERSSASKTVELDWNLLLSTQKRRMSSGDKTDETKTEKVEPQREGLEESVGMKRPKLIKHPCFWQRTSDQLSRTTLCYYHTRFQLNIKLTEYSCLSLIVEDCSRHPTMVEKPLSSKAIFIYLMAL